LIEPEYEGQLIHIDTHVSGNFLVTGGSARGARYGVGGIPHVQFDGMTSVIGAGSCASAAAAFRPQIDNRLNTTGGVTPVDMSLNMVVSGTQATVTGTAELVDNIALTGLQMTLFVLEDDIVWCCDSQGGNQWANITRGIHSVPVTLTFGGGEVEIEHTFTLSGAVNSDNIWAAAVVEKISGTDEIYQAAHYKNLLRVKWDQAVASVPAGSGEAIVTGEIFNGNELDDVFDLVLSGDQGGWTQEFQLDGDPNWYTNATISIPGGASHGVTMRVNTDATVGIGGTTLDAVGQATAFASSGIFRVFNGAKAVLFVDGDNDDGRGLEEPYLETLDTLNPLYDSVLPALLGTGPSGDQMAGYDLVIWETGYVSSNSILTAAGESLQDYLATGGNLLLCNQGFGSAPANTAALRTALGCSSSANDTKADQSIGVVGEITEGMSFVLDWPSPGVVFNRADTVNPVGGGTAATIFFNEVGHSNAIRQETGSGQRTILNTIEPEAFGEDTGNDDQVVEAMITWLLGGGDPTSVDDLPFVSSLMSASPNPFSPRADVQFALSDWAAQQDVSLRVVDAAGRLVRDLYDGQLDAGSHSIEWNGQDNGGKNVANGLYFAILDSADGKMKTKLMKVSN